MADLVKNLEEDAQFSSWKTLPSTFLEQTMNLSPDDAIDVASRLWSHGEHRFLYAASMLLRCHPAAFQKVRWKMLEPMGNAMDSWWAVDMFAFLAGPAWRAGQISDARVLRWARSKIRWWRRAALVCTVCLNRKSLGGSGDIPRTLAICEELASDSDDVVAKGLSWALRELIVHDRSSVEDFLLKHDSQLPALVKREVRNKLTTGLKNPRRARTSAYRRSSV